MFHIVHKWGVCATFCRQEIKNFVSSHNHSVYLINFTLQLIDFTRIEKNPNLEIIQDRLESKLTILSPNHRELLSHLLLIKISLHNYHDKIFEVSFVYLQQCDRSTYSYCFLADKAVQIGWIKWIIFLIFRFS
jgi:hypothetical protein